jgi:hypothetical protein
MVLDSEVWRYILKVHDSDLRHIRRNYDVSITSSGEEGDFTTVSKVGLNMS